LTGLLLNKKYLYFAEAREFVHTLGLKNSKGWRRYCKSGKKPEDIPSAPEQVYKNKGWKSWGDWIGTGNIATYEKDFLPFEEAKRFVHKLGLMSQAEWRKYINSKYKPQEIPSNPNKVYKENWKSYGDWLGTGRIADQYRNYRSFEEAKKFVHSLGLRTQEQWQQYCKSGNKPEDIPSNPHSTYKENWKSYGDWLGTGNIALSQREYRPFQEARTFTHSLGLTSSTEWDIFY
jgi:Integrase repeat unit